MINFENLNKAYISGVGKYDIPKIRENANNVLSWGKKEAESNPQYKLLSSAQKTASNKRFSDLKKAISEETSASSIIDKMKGINFSDTSKNGKAQAFTQLVRKYT